jgi:hypothetical protein
MAEGFTPARFPGKAKVVVGAIVIRSCAEANLRRHSRDKSSRQQLPQVAAVDSQRFLSSIRTRFLIAFSAV